MSTIAIIGAGCSGLAAAHILRDTGHKVTLFEKSNGVGGRAATRQRSDFTYDDGAQYIKQGSPASVTLITERFRSPDLIDIEKPVWIFDGSNHIQEGDTTQNAEPKWNYRHGLNTLPQLMANGQEIRFGTEITRLRQTRQGWELFNDVENSEGTFDRLMIAIPARQASALLQASDLEHDLHTTLHTYLQQSRYNPLISVMLGYRPAPRTRPFYALVNTDKTHPISWLAYEHEKAPERAPTGTGLLIAQMAPSYSTTHWQTPDSLLAHDVAELVRTLLQEDLPTAYFSDVKRWFYALPASTLDANQVNALALPQGLAFCGDGFTGGRVHLALEHGMMVAQQFNA